MNKVILVGNLARDPELRQTPQGTSVARFTVAVSRRFSRDGQQQTDFISCVAWRSTAEFLCRYFTKGSGIQLCGSIQSRSWDGQDGQRHYATEVVADEISFNGPKSSNQSSGGYSQPASGQPSFGQSASGQQPSFGQQSAPSYPSSDPSSAPQLGGDVDGDFDSLGFADLDGSEDDLPF